ncbi:MAG TPA: PaaI family thioesterase [Acetobacteraceae bacterium]|nr:PaaI family thioesterase [Acetobacteraceae bacterium]
MTATASRMAAVAYGVPRPADIAGMTGRAILQAIIDGALPQPPIADSLSFLLTEVREGFAAFTGNPGPHLLNPMGNVHGGWALTLIDSAGGCAALSLLPPGVSYATVETKVNFSRPITADTGPVRAEAHVVGHGRQIISAEARVLRADGKVLAHGTSTLLVSGGAR